MKPSLRIPVSDMSQVGEARRMLAFYDRDIQRTEVKSGEIAIIVTELATNLVKHGGGGEIIVTAQNEMLDIVSIDKGPGIGNIEASVQDGYSTSGTPGNGLGAVKRLSDFFDIFSIPQKGTAILARVGVAQQNYLFGGVCIPVSGETECGDRWAYRVNANGNPQVMVVDGLGHGPTAAEAADAAVKAFQESKYWDAPSVFQDLHGALRSTRGAAISVIDIDESKRIALFTGIGNVAGMITQESGVKRMISHAGIVGQNMRKVQEFTYPIENLLSNFILHSDGVTTHWDLSMYPGLSFKHPAIVAAVVFRDQCRGRDDATVVVFKRDLSR